MVVPNFEIGDLVWAKMKSFPPWPAKIASPPEKPAGGKKGHHYVQFFGTKDHAWIIDDKIEPHNVEMVDRYKGKKLSGFQEAINEIVLESKDHPPKKQPVDPAKITFAVSEAFDSLKKNSVGKVKKSPEKKKAKKRQAELNGSGYTSFSVSCSLSVGPSPAKRSFMVVDKSLNTSGGSSTQSELNLPTRILKKRPYIDRPDTPPLIVDKISDSLQMKDIRTTSKRIGFLGLTAMACGIVKNLINSKHNVTVYNTQPEKCEPFVKHGAKMASTPSDVVESCDIIFCCVADAEETKKIVYGNFGVLVGFDNSKDITSKGYVELTSIDPETSKGINDEIRMKGGRYLEAPVAGSRSEADEGRLLIMASGDHELFIACESCFNAFSKNSFYIGEEVGHACKMSIIFSMFNGTLIAALAEAIAMLKISSLSCEKFLSIIATRGISSPLIHEKGSAMVSENYAVESALLHQQRDLSMALTLGNNANQPLVLTSFANEVYKKARKHYYGEHDVAAVIESIRLDAKS